MICKALNNIHLAYTFVNTNIHNTWFLSGRNVNCWRHASPAAHFSRGQREGDGYAILSF